MPKYRIVIEDTRTELRAKTFEAATLADAVTAAEDDLSWTPKDGWEHWDEGHTNCEIREDQCELIP